MHLTRKILLGNQIGLIILALPVFIVAFTFQNSAITNINGNFPEENKFDVQKAMVLLRNFALVGCIAAILTQICGILGSCFKSKGLIGFYLCLNICSMIIVGFCAIAPIVLSVKLHSYCNAETSECYICPKGDSEVKCMLDAAFENKKCIIMQDGYQACKDLIKKLDVIVVFFFIMEVLLLSSNILVCCVLVKDKPIREAHAYVQAHFEQEYPMKESDFR